MKISGRVATPFYFLLLIVAGAALWSSQRYGDAQMVTAIQQSGSRIWMDAGAPGPTLGAINDVYINSTNDDVYQKTGSGWGAPTTNIRGAAGTPGTPGTVFQSDRLTTATDGTVTWTYPVAYAGGVIPQVWGVAQGPDPTAGALINLQLLGAPTNTQAKFQANRSNVTTVALLGLNILSIPASPGATVITVFAKAP